MAFSADITAFIKKAQGNADAAVRAVAVEVADRVIDRTPVESGAARGNWTGGIGAPDLAKTGRLDPGGAVTRAAVAAALASAKAGDVLYVTNTLPYILNLEHGSSKQAPTGMVSTTLREAADIVRTVTDKLP